MKFYAVREGREKGIFKTWEECQAQVVGYPGAVYKSFKSYEEAEVYLAGFMDSSKKEIKKFYAVREGREKGIFKTWDECQSQIVGYKGAVYKSFKSYEEAESYLLEDAFISKENIAIRHEGVFAYIDGSFDSKSGIYGSGIVIVNNGVKIVMKEAGNDTSLADLHNVAGEIEAAKIVMNYARENQIKEITLYYDYKGIEAWALGKWKTNLPYTENYASFAKEIFKSVKVNFVKVKAHTGVVLNEEVDNLAKEAIEDFKITGDSSLKIQIKDHVDTIRCGKVDFVSPKEVLDNNEGEIQSLNENTCLNIDEENFQFGTDEDLSRIEKMKNKDNKQLSFFDEL